MQRRSLFMMSANGDGNSDGASTRSLFGDLSAQTDPQLVSRVRSVSASTVVAQRSAVFSRTARLAPAIWPSARILARMQLIAQDHHVTEFWVRRWKIVMVRMGTMCHSGRFAFLGLAGLGVGRGGGCWLLFTVNLVSLKIWWGPSERL